MFGEPTFRAAQTKLHFGRNVARARHFMQQQMHVRSCLGVLAGTMSMAAMLSAGNSNAADGAAASVARHDSTWRAEAAQRRGKIEQTIKQNPLAFRAFDTGSLGDATLEMIPYVMFRVLQELEPAVFGGEALKSFGFFERKDSPSGLNGITWTRPVKPISPQMGAFELRYFTRTCASCHTGRVRLDNGEIRILNGGANTEIRLHYFVGRLTETLKARLGSSNDSPQCQAFKSRITGVLAQREVGWYWGPDSSMPLADATKELETVSANLDAILSQMRVMNDHRLATLALLQKYSYDKVHNPPSLTGGAPGIVETAGLGSAALLPAIGEDKAGMVLPPGPSKADIPSVWQLDANGYANWDATVKGFSRALTSRWRWLVTLKRSTCRPTGKFRRFCPRFRQNPCPSNLIWLRSSGVRPYTESTAWLAMTHHRAVREMPWSLMCSPIRRGQWQHRPWRRKSCRKSSVPSARKIRSASLPILSSEDMLPDPWWVFGRKRRICTMDRCQLCDELLVPSLRTSKPFLRGSISYDAGNGGWEWDPAKEETLRRNGDVAVSLHDINESGLGNFGHGSVERQFMTVGSAKARIAWTDSKKDRKAVDDLIAYLLSL